MTYGAEAAIPLKTGFPTLKTSSFTSGSNDRLLEKSLDLIEERRENVMVQLAYYQHKLKQGHIILKILRKRLYHAPGIYITLEDIIINEGSLHPIWVCYIEHHMSLTSI